LKIKLHPTLIVLQHEGTRADGGLGLVEVTVLRLRQHERQQGDQAEDQLNDSK
jgi:hypothetical protein